MAAVLTSGLGNS